MIDTPELQSIIECYSFKAVKYFLRKFSAGTTAKRYRLRRCNQSKTLGTKFGAWYYDSKTWYNSDKSDDELAVWMESAQKKKALHDSKKQSNARAKNGCASSNLMLQ